jgi:hypothetical protein
LSLLLLLGDANSTGIVRISLQPTATPATRTGHAIVARARIQASNTARLRAALYEAGFNRSGDLESPNLSTLLTDYTFSIPDANAALIRGYTNLELRLWGVSLTGAISVFEVAEAKVSMPLPASSTLFIAAGYDSGQGTDSAVVVGTSSSLIAADGATGVDTATVSISAPQSKSAADTGVGADVITSLVSNVVAAPTMPELALEVSFDADSGPNYKESVTIAKPALYYRLGETSGGYAIDQMSTLNLQINGSVTLGQASLLSGDSNQCYSFAKTPGGFLYTGGESGQLDSDELTCECILRPNLLSGISTLFYRLDNLVGGTIWQIYLDNGYLAIKVAGALLDGEPPDTPKTYYTYKSTYLFSSSVTYHIAVVVRIQSVDFYVNGVLVDTTPKSWEEIFKISNASFVIGAEWTGAWVNFYDGLLDEPAVFTRALDPEEIEYHSVSRSAVSAYTWTLISGDTTANSFLKALSVKRGAQDIFRDVETGVFTGVLHNNDRRFDPNNTSSPYYPSLKPARPMRLRATKDGISRDLFRGDVEDWPQDWKGRSNEVPVTGLDALDILAGVDVRITRPQEVSGARIHAILDHAAWPQELRLIDTGEELIAECENQEGTARELLLTVKNAESGYIYVNGSGQVVFQQRNKRFAPPFSTVKATFSNIPQVGEFPLVDVEVVEDKDQIKNHVRIKITDTVDSVVAQDPQSILDHRKRSHEEELPLTSTTAAQLRAEWILSLYKDPLVRITDVVVEPQMDPGLWAHCLDREIGDRLRFKIFPPGKPGTMHDLQANIEYVEHRYVVGRWTTTWKVSVADTSHYWVLGTDQLGVSTKLAY